MSQPTSALDLAAIYSGREATAVKHLILRRYLQKLAYKVGTWCETINYVEGFAGPWRSQTEDLSDTSPHIAVKELRAAREGLGRALQRGPRLRCLFCEKDQEAAQTLAESLRDAPRVDVRVINGEYLEHVDDIVNFAHDPSTPSPRFTFVFVDPTGWTDYDPEVMEVLLRERNTEVLVTFMTNDIVRFVDDSRESVRRTFNPLFAREGARERWTGLHGQEREVVILDAFRTHLREIGNFRHVVSSIVRDPTKARTKFHLVLGTHNDKGLRTFREVEFESLRDQMDLRGTARQRKRIKATQQQERFPSTDIEQDVDLLRLRANYHSDAREALIATLQTRGAVSFDELELAAMQHDLVRSRDVRDWLGGLRSQGLVRFEGLKPKERTLKPASNHRVVWVGPPQ